PSLESVAEMTGLGVDDVERFYSLFAATERAVTLYSQGVNQSVCGSDKVNAIINCHLATGRIGRTGMGPFSLTGQPNAMGGREVGGLANQLAAHMNFTPPDIDRVRRFWNAPGIAERPGLKAVEMFEAVEEGRIKAIWIAATNPAASMPRARRIREALANCPLVIVSDAWPTDTTRLARVVLPAASWAEKDGTVTNSERVISRQRAFRKAPGKARPDWWMFAQVGQRLGWEHAFSYRSSAEIFREHAELSSFENHGQRLFDLGALATLSDDAYDSLQPTRWPCPNSKRGEKRLFGGGRFATPDGRARMVPVAPPAQTLGGDYSLILNTGRVRDQWHTMTRTGRVPHLMTHTAAPRICLHPKDATRFGIGDGRLARIESAHGRGVMLAALDDRLRPGEAFLAMHWTDEFASTGPVGTFVHARRDPLSGQPDLKATPIRVAPVDEIWQGRLVRLATAPLSLGDTAYWCKMPLLKGAMYELAGWSELSGIIDSEAALRSLLAIPASAEIISYSDPKKMIFRYAGVIEGSLEACIHFAPAGENLQDTALAATALGKTLAPAARLALLAGLDARPAQPSRIICSCFSVSEDAIADVVKSRKLETPAQIGEVLRAGSNCGSCIPELKKLIATQRRIVEPA
ncbi:MAG TPA: molybdopterin-dependent oxidoreductase, partial [Rhizomicrobium sp.]|nr:molybdopterin-dependent oxidoreductase [Rhizomicrobium sp.]